MMRHGQWYLIIIKIPKLFVCLCLNGSFLYFWYKTRCKKNNNLLLWQKISACKICEKINLIKKPSLIACKCMEISVNLWKIKKSAVWMSDRKKVPRKEKSLQACLPEISTLFFFFCYSLSELRSFLLLFLKSLFSLSYSILITSSFFSRRSRFFTSK